MNTVLSKVRVPRSRRTRKRRSALAKFLARNELPIFAPETVERYKAEKVEFAAAKFAELRSYISRIEWRTNMLKQLWAWTNLVLVFGAGTGAVLTGLGAIVALALVYFAPGVAALSFFGPACLMVVSIAALAGVEWILKPIVGIEVSVAKMRSLLKRSRQSPTIKWAETPLADYCYRVPKRVRKLAARIEQALPHAKLSVEYTLPVEYAMVDSALWEWNPDPFLRVSIGEESYRVAAWEEDGHEPACRYLH